jgi:hypothetical protein
MAHRSHALEDLLAQRAGRIGQGLDQRAATFALLSDQRHLLHRHFPSIFKLNTAIAA